MRMVLAGLLLLLSVVGAHAFGIGKEGRLTGKLGAIGGAVATIQLSNASIPDSTASGSTVGTLSVSNGKTYTYSLTSNPGALFSIVGTALKTASTLTAGSYPITIRATGSTVVPDRVFTIIVTSAAAASDPIPYYY